ncbi:hypothetical protein [Streptomyces inhibens]|uniref:hypothetical protein n=1 Tax=Streptomyces inhibens TaxID=2293571 RepID=UPI001EE770F4|nr:hypothetical protein [Streptomyces inhibens]UKY55586.1 hypothetical protein KI385_02415 [Streptomyces inhibens]
MSGGISGGLPPVAAARTAEALAARHAALARMTAECTALGGDGVVAANLTMAP